MDINAGVRKGRRTGSRRVQEGRSSEESENYTSDEVSESGSEKGAGRPPRRWETIARRPSPSEGENKA
jgi:hypothetical protein